jgi:flagellar L-ring protein FlgH
MTTRSAFRTDSKGGAPFPLRPMLAAALGLSLAVVPAVRADSLWTSRSGSLVTIVIDEKSSADKTGETKLDRDGSYSTEQSIPGFTYPRWLRGFLLSLKASGTGKSNYAGSGSTTRTDHASGQITAKVMRVLDTGALVIEGRKMVVLQEEAQMIVVSGIVRPQDVAADNTVRSTALADAEVRIEGRGVISSRQHPGIIQRVFDFLGLF